MMLAIFLPEMRISSERTLTNGMSATLFSNSLWKTPHAECRPNYNLVGLKSLLWVITVSKFLDSGFNSNC